MSAELVCKHQLGRIAPCLPRCCTKRILRIPLMTEDLHDKRRDRDEPGSSVLGRRQDVFAVDLVGFRELLVDVERVSLEIHAVPCQTQDLTLPETGKQRDHIDILKAAALDCIDKLPYVILLQRCDLGPVSYYDDL